MAARVHDQSLFGREIDYSLWYDQSANCHALLFSCIESCRFVCGLGLVEWAMFARHTCRCHPRRQQCDFSCTFPLHTQLLFTTGNR